MIHLSQRLSIALTFLSDSKVLADIGTDHGYFPIEAVRTGRVERAFATDNKQKPLDNALANIEKAQLTDKIKTVLMDGIVGLDDSVDTLSLLGMGGDLIVTILANGELDTVKRLILGPHSKADKVRLFLQTHQYVIEDETFFEEKGTFYHLMTAVKGPMTLSVPEMKYGRINLQRKNPVLKRHLLSEISRLETALLDVKTQSGKASISHKINEMRGVLDEWY